MKAPRVRDQRGYTLAELLVAIAVVGLLMSGLFLTLREGQTAYQYGSTRVEVQQNARVALARIMRELRAARSFTTTSATDVKFKFLDDTGTNIEVEYLLGGTNLQRNQTGAAGQPETLIGGVQSLAITYFDVSNVVTTTPANVRSVDIKITTRPEDPTLAAANVRTAVVQSRVRVRNE